MLLYRVMHDSLNYHLSETLTNYVNIFGIRIFVMAVNSLFIYITSSNVTTTYSFTYNVWNIQQLVLLIVNEYMTSVI